MSVLAHTEKIPIHGNEYETPQRFFDALHAEFNFVFDVACNAENKKLPHGFVYPEQDALTSEWPKNGWLWLNPPYKPLRPWIEKCQTEVIKGARVCYANSPGYLSLQVLRTC